MVLAEGRAPAAARATDELTQFLLQLKGFDAHELGLVAAQAAHVRGELRKVGVELGHPQLAALQFPSLLRELSAAIVEAQKRDSHRAPGMMVWAHTLRAEQRPELRYLAKEMWAYLELGFPEAELAAYDYETVTGERLAVSAECLEVPRGYVKLSAA